MAEVCELSGPDPTTTSDPSLASATSFQSFGCPEESRIPVG